MAAARLSSPHSDAGCVKTCFKLTLSNGYSLLIQGILLSLPIPVLPSLSPQGLGRTGTGGGPWGARLNANTQPSWKVLALRGQRHLSLSSRGTSCSRGLASWLVLEPCWQGEVVKETPL